MQRRAAALWVALFLVLGVASYSLIATATPPTIGFENPEHELSQGETFTVGDRTYTVSGITASTSGGGGGGHGGGATLERSGELTWTNDSARYTATWANGSTVTYEDQQYLVLISDSPDPDQFVLEETINRSAILQDDPDAANETVTQGGTEYVVVTRDGQKNLVPTDEYFPEPATRQFDEGQTIDYRGNQTEIATVTNQSATLAWTAPRQNTVELADQSNVTLAGTTYLAFFPDNTTVVLTQNFESYDRQQTEIAEHHERVNGLWGISILSGLVSILLVGMAYLPSRY